jgi:hypothetical protein
VKVSLSVIRFLFEAAFILLIAASTAVAHLGKLWIALSVGGAWLLVVVVERTALQDHAVLHNGRFGFLFAGRRAQAAVEEPVAEELPPLPSHVTLLEPAADEHPPTPVPEPEPSPPEPAPPAPEPQPPTPGPTDPAPQLRPVPLPEPEPEPEPTWEPEPDPVVAYLPRADGEPREWNIWELERLAQGGEGKDAMRDEELGFLLLELRQFANADGRLPVSFDPVVRESFGELLYAAI